MNNIETPKNSAEALLDLRATLHKLDQTMTNGPTNQSPKLAINVESLATALLKVIVSERAEIVAREQRARDIRSQQRIGA